MIIEKTSEYFLFTKRRIKEICDDAEESEPNINFNKIKEVYSMEFMESNIGHEKISPKFTKIDPNTIQNSLYHKKPFFEIYDELSDANESQLSGVLNEKYKFSMNRTESKSNKHKLSENIENSIFSDTSSISDENNHSEYMFQIKDRNNILQKKASNDINTFKTHNVIFDSLKLKLFNCKNLLSDLRVNLKRHCLPSFGKRRQKMAHINSQKTELNLVIVQTENLISDLSLSEEYPEKMVIRMKDFFGSKLRKILIEYRCIEEEFLEKISNVKIFDDIDYYNDEKRKELKYHENETAVTDYLSENNFYENGYTNQGNNTYGEMMHVKRSSDAEHVRKGIFFITTLLLELKMICKAQTSKIDRIEMYFQDINDTLHATNEIITVLPKKHNRIKNRIIYFLSITVIILVFLSMIKAMKRKGII